MTFLKMWSQVLSGLGILLLIQLLITAIDSTNTLLLTIIINNEATYKRHC